MTSSHNCHENTHIHAHTHEQLLEMSSSTFLEGRRPRLSDKDKEREERRRRDRVIQMTEEEEKEEEERTALYVAYLLTPSLSGLHSRFLPF